LSDPKLERLLVRDLLFRRFIDLLSGKESEVDAYSAYKSKKHEDWLEDHHVNNKVIEHTWNFRHYHSEWKSSNLATVQFKAFAMLATVVMPALFVPRAI
jgi:hypothetical protein